MIKLSQTTKMPCKSWSLPALDTCPGSRDKNGQLVEICQGCYATTGNYRFPNVMFAREHNRQDWKRSEWVDDMVEAIGSDPYFRWFDSGDIYHPKLAQKILEVMKLTRNTMHWLPTRSHKVKGLRAIIASMKKMKNVSVRYSSDKINGLTLKHGSFVFDHKMFPNFVIGRSIIAAMKKIKNVKVEGLDDIEICMASTRGGQCGPCRSCWDKSVKVIAYPDHGKNMEKVIERLAS
jgi:hypothetical protein